MIAFDIGFGGYRLGKAIRLAVISLVLLAALVTAGWFLGVGMTALAHIG